MKNEDISVIYIGRKIILHVFRQGSERGDGPVCPLVENTVGNVQNIGTAQGLFRFRTRNDGLRQKIMQKTEDKLSFLCQA